jgi:hypothetical protein
MGDEVRQWARQVQRQESADGKVKCDRLQGAEAKEEKVLQDDGLLAK